ncbi:hypothetical protein L6164_022734 [Bauhinia variegata]|uniref:Uncharacterized protein n=1 Tax=Bauhinia variegata TaxID=167791 RepID=A0ACB9MHL0_BAUVA|nr:hypothetical protein L6164_022734 [Bauhinia variegata]
MLLDKVLVVAAICIGLLALAINGNVGVKAGACEKSYVEIIQGPTGATLPSGAKVFSVQILNECPTDCKISELYLSCGQFSSEKLIPPTIFKRVGDDQCLVNNGMPIAAGSVVSFEYANKNQFPLQVSSLRCIPGINNLFGWLIQISTF